MTDIPSIYGNARQAWEQRLLSTVETALIEVANQDPDPASYLFRVYREFNTTDWRNALPMTLPLVPEQFRHLWTAELARNLMKTAFITPALKLVPGAGASYMEKVARPLLEKAGFTLQKAEVSDA